MHRLFKLLAASCALAAALAFSGNALAARANAAKETAKKAATSVTPAASDKEIADAKAKGLVWVNTATKIYHKGGRFYGKTKQGKFMTEAEAEKAGYHAEKTGSHAEKPSPLSDKRSSASEKK